MKINRRLIHKAVGVKEGNKLICYLYNNKVPRTTGVDKTSKYSSWVNFYDSDVVLEALDKDSKFGGAKRNLEIFKKVIEYAERTGYEA